MTTTLILSALKSVIQGWTRALRSHQPTAAKPRAALQADSGYDLVLLDLHLGDTHGFDLLAELREVYPAIAVVVISASDRSSDVIRAIDMGCHGLRAQRASNETLVAALQTSHVRRRLCAAHDHRFPTRKPPTPAPNGMAATTCTPPFTCLSGA